MSEQAPKLPPISEEQFQKQVIQYAKLRGWRVAHFRPAMTKSGRWVTAVQADGAGFPDLVLVRGDVVLWMELKAEKGKLSPEQQAWFDALMAARQEVYVFKPSHWSVIETVLT